MSASEPRDEPPPILGSWRNVYILVLAFLGIVIVALYSFMRFFS